MKHIAQEQGRAVLIIDSFDGESCRLADGEQLDLSWLDKVIAQRASGLSGYILQSKLTPHPWIRELTNGARTSFRINTLRVPKGEPIVQFAMARLGRSKAMIDHFSQGGIYAPVDIATGVIGSGLMLEDGIETWTDVHPDSEQRIDATPIPSFDAILACAREAAAITPGMRAVGWDIVLSEMGPRMIEGNIGWNIVLKQRLGGGWMANGVVQAWHDHWGIDIPDDSLRWRLQTSSRLGRLLRLS